jgi:hypothetical protein
MSTTEDSMNSDETVGQQQPPERPATRTTDDEIVKERERHNERLSSIEMEPGARRTENIGMLVVEAELVAEGKQLDNPAKPRTQNVGEEFRERLDKHDDDLVPAWTRPWEGDE